MVALSIEGSHYHCDLSVLALSSRFDGRIWPGCVLSPDRLSVLALSSRFDGHDPGRS